MKVYLDLIFITNFLFDFIILLSVSIILKRNVKIIKIVLGAFFGSITVFSLFLRFNSVSLFFFKLVISIGMLLITFSFKNIRYFFKNFYYLYMVSIIMGGVLYFINIQLSYKNIGLLFITNGFNINILISIPLSIFVLYKYIKQIKNLKTNYNKYYKITIYLKEDEKYVFNGFLDTGNKLVDPYKKYPIILVNEDKIKSSSVPILVPYRTVSGNGLLKCIKPLKVYIEGIGFRSKVFIGLSSVNIDSVDCILNEMLLEG